MSELMDRPARVDLAEGGWAAVVDRTPGPADLDPARYAARRRRRDTALRVGAPLLLLLVWQLVSMTGALSPNLWPSPAKVFGAFLEMLRIGLLQEATLSSLHRLLVGYVVGAVAGYVVGLALGEIRPLRVALVPIVSALYTVPKLAILPLLLLIFGLGDAPKIILIALGVFFILAISTVANVIGVAETDREPAASFHSSWLQTQVHVVIPAIVPGTFTALRIACGNALLILVGMEFIQGESGLGYLIWNSWQLYRADRMYVGIVVVAVLGALFQSLVGWIGQRLAPWAQLTDRAPV